MSLPKIEKVRNYLKKYPEANVQKIAERFDVHPTAVYKARIELEPRARKVMEQKPKSNLIKDIETIQKIGVERVKQILNLL